MTYNKSAPVLSPQLRSVNHHHAERYTTPIRFFNKATVAIIGGYNSRVGDKDDSIDLIDEDSLSKRH